jgi:hypothetical protein
MWMRHDVGDVPDCHSRLGRPRGEARNQEWRGAGGLADKKPCAKGYARSPALTGDLVGGPRPIIEIGRTRRRGVGAWGTKAATVLCLSRRTTMICPLRPSRRRRKVGSDVAVREPSVDCSLMVNRQPSRAELSAGGIAVHKPPGFSGWAGTVRALPRAPTEIGQATSVCLQVFGIDATANNPRPPGTSLGYGETGCRSGETPATIRDNRTYFTIPASERSLNNRTTNLALLMNDSDSRPGP